MTVKFTGISLARQDGDDASSDELIQDDLWTGSDIKNLPDYTY
jgi:hypothetical protein